MAFVCVLIRTQAKIPKTWYARSVAHRTITLLDLFCKFASGEFDDGGKNIDSNNTGEECKQLYIIKLAVTNS